MGSNVTIESGGLHHQPTEDNQSTNDLLTLTNNKNANSSGVGSGGACGKLSSVGGEADQLEQLTKQSYYDSGIDIREPIPNIQPIPKKTVYSDADIVLSSDWVPPKPIPTTVATSLQDTLSSNEATRKKTSSVSFSVEDSGGGGGGGVVGGQSANTTAQGDKKNKVSLLIKQIKEILSEIYLIYFRCLNDFHILSVGWRG